MDIDEAKVWAGEYIVNRLVDGQQFGGLGSVARSLIQMVAQDADENAKHLSKETARTPELWQAMQKRVSEEFVLGILGMGEFTDERGFRSSSRTPVQAAAVLVEQVWHAYIEWAQHGALLVDTKKAGRAGVGGVGTAF